MRLYPTRTPLAAIKGCHRAVAEEVNWPEKNTMSSWYDRR
jgi:hypothetical protein